MENKIKDLLIKARELISDKANWTKDAPARMLEFDGFYQSTDPEDPEACQWCATGAVERAFHDNPDFDEMRDFRFKTAAQMALDAATPYGGGSILSFNDHYYSTHEQILAIFDKAIADITQEHEQNPSVYLLRLYNYIKGNG